MLEPPASILQHFGMHRFSDEMFQVLDGLPYGQVIEKARSVERDKGCCENQQVRLFEVLSTKPPNESLAAFCQRIHFVNARCQTGHCGIVQWRTHPGDVYLGQ